MNEDPIILNSNYVIQTYHMFVFASLFYSQMGEECYIHKIVSQGWDSKKNIINNLFQDIINKMISNNILDD